MQRDTAPKYTQLLNIHSAFLLQHGLDSFVDSYLNFNLCKGHNQELTQAAGDGTTDLGPS